MRYSLVVSSLFLTNVWSMFSMIIGDNLIIPRLRVEYAATLAIKSPEGYHMVLPENWLALDLVDQNDIHQEWYQNQ